MQNKKQNNTLGLKVSFIPATNEAPNFWRLTQTNNKKSIKISSNIDLEIIDFISLILNSISEIRSFNLVVDNTQNKYYLFSIDFIGNSFLDILDNFKKF